MARSRVAAAAEYRRLLADLNAHIRREKDLAAGPRDGQTWTLPAMERSLQHQVELDRVRVSPVAATALRGRLDPGAELDLNVHAAPPVQGQLHEAWGI